MAKIDWQADLTKKVDNLVRKFKFEAEGHGARVDVDVSVVVRVPPSKSSPTLQGETSTVGTGKASRVSATGNKRKADKVKNESKSE
jgi:hypothetical protein